jgi:hypothetical protein
MDDQGPIVAATVAAGVSVRPLEFARMATLRYFEASGAFARGLAEGVGGPLPRPLQALRYAVGEPPADIDLLGLNPTETLALFRDDAGFARLEARASGFADGCLVEQTGGWWACAITGARAPDLLARLGSSTAVPAPLEARTGRLAEVAVTSWWSAEGEIALLVERVYSGHLCGWIRATLEDF